ncbi:hypothetical protein AMTRI_Chr03g47300 [Amborella trichopoda]
MQSCPYDKVPRTKVVRLKKKRTLTDFIEIISTTVDNLGVIMNKRPHPGLTTTTRMATTKEIVQYADVMTLFLNMSEEDRAKYVLDVYGVHS